MYVPMLSQKSTYRMWSTYACMYIVVRMQLSHTVPQAICGLDQNKILEEFDEDKNTLAHCAAENGSSDLFKVHM